MVASSSRSLKFRPRVRPLMPVMNFSCAGFRAGLASSPPIDNPRVSGFLDGVSALTIWSSVTSPARAWVAPKENAAPMATTETSAVRYRFADILDIAGPSCARFSRDSEKNFDNGSRPTGHGRHYLLFVSGHSPGVRGCLRPQRDLIYLTP